MQQWFANISKVVVAQDVNANYLFRLLKHGAMRNSPWVECSKDNRSVEWMPTWCWSWCARSLSRSPLLDRCRQGGREEERKEERERRDVDGKNGSQGASAQSKTQRSQHYNTEQGIYEAPTELTVATSAEAELWWTYSPTSSDGSHGATGNGQLAPVSARRLYSHYALISKPFSHHCIGSQEM